MVLFTYYTYINACFFLDSFPLCNYKTLNIHIAVYEIDEQEGKHLNTSVDKEKKIILLM